MATTGTKDSAAKRALKRTGRGTLLAISPFWNAALIRITRTAAVPSNTAVARRVAQSGSRPVNGRLSKKATTRTVAIGKIHDIKTKSKVRIPRTIAGRTSVICTAQEKANATTGITNH